MRNKNLIELGVGTREQDEMAGSIQRTLNSFWESRIVRYVTDENRETNMEYLNMSIRHFIDIETTMVRLCLDLGLSIKSTSTIKKGILEGLPRRFEVYADRNVNFETIGSKLKQFYSKGIKLIVMQNAYELSSLKTVYRSNELTNIPTGELYVYNNPILGIKEIVRLEHVNYNSAKKEVQYRFFKHNRKEILLTFNQVQKYIAKYGL